MLQKQEEYSPTFSPGNSFTISIGCFHGGVVRRPALYGRALFSSIVDREGCKHCLFQWISSHSGSATARRVDIQRCL
jgi:hypothetical protein